MLKFLPILLLAGCSGQTVCTVTNQMLLDQGVFTRKGEMISVSEKWGTYPVDFQEAAAQCWAQEYGAPSVFVDWRGVAVAVVPARSEAKAD